MPKKESKNEVTMTAHWGCVVQPKKGKAIIVPNKDWVKYYSWYGKK